MAKYVSAVECAEKISEKFGIHLGDLVDVFAEIPAADVVPIPDVDETLEDLLVEFDEFGMQPTILVPDPEDRAIRWKRELEYAIGRIKAEVAREICCKIEEEIVAALESNYRARKEHIERYADFAYDTELLLEINGKLNALRGIEGFVEELKKKYTEAEK